MLFGYLHRSKYSVLVILLLSLTTLSCKTKNSVSLKKKPTADPCIQQRDSLLNELARLKETNPSEQMTALMNSIKSALPGLNDDDLKVEIRKGKVYVSMSDKLLFKSGSASVEGKGKEALKSLAAILNKYPDIEVLVEGHTDNLPIKTAMYKDNWDLSTARAASIVRILSQEYKIHPARLVAAGRGEYYPLSDNKTADGRSKNRRTEIVLTPNLDRLYKILEK